MDNRSSFFKFKLQTAPQYALVALNRFLVPSPHCASLCDTQSKLNNPMRLTPTAVLYSFEFWWVAAEHFGILSNARFYFRSYSITFKIPHFNIHCIGVVSIASHPKQQIYCSIHDMMSSSKTITKAERAISSSDLTNKRGCYTHWVYFVVRVTCGQHMRRNSFRFPFPRSHADAWKGALCSFWINCPRIESGWTILQFVYSIILLKPRMNEG